MEFPVASVRRVCVSAAAVVALAGLLGGCGAAGRVPVDPGVPTPTAPTPTAQVSLPAGGVSMAELGFRHGPAAMVSLPDGVQVGVRVDQPNVITAAFTEPGGAQIASWLRTSLPGGGFTVSADDNDSLLFAGYGWSGAFTVTERTSALTLRRDPG